MARTSSATPPTRLRSLLTPQTAIRWQSAGGSSTALHPTSGRPAVTPSFDQITTVNLGGSMVFGGSINPGGWVGQIFLAADRSGGPTNNNIYMLATIQPTGFTNGTDVMFVRS